MNPPADKPDTVTELASSERPDGRVPAAALAPGEGGARSRAAAGTVASSTAIKQRTRAAARACQAPCAAWPEPTVVATMPKTLRCRRELEFHPARKPDAIAARSLVVCRTRTLPHSRIGSEG